MADSLTPAERSRRMSLIRGRDTKPEMLVRRMAHALGFRFRLHRRDLPGCPDLVFPRLKRVVFVHGCFWHRHQGCKRARLPKSRHEFWVPKLEGNRLRDRRNRALLKKLGWDCLVVWECQLERPEWVGQKLERYLTEGGK